MRQYFDSPLWKLFSLLLILSWLVPNHYWPWVGFHSDLWMAGCLALAFLALVVTRRTELSIGREGIVLLIFSFLPMIQYVAGGIYFSGEAVVYSMYLFGLFLSFSVAGGMEEVDAYRFIDYLFFAIGSASLLSVGLQFCQWFGLVESLNIWAIDAGGGRPGANFAQPNNLGTFLLWGGIAFYWFWARGSISAPVTIFAIAFLLIGVALTQSRTSILGCLLVVLLLGVWRHQKNGRSVFWIGVSLLLWLLIWLKISSVMAPLTPLGSLADRFSDATMVFKDPVRLSIYKNLLIASARNPWVGFGFDGVGEAFFEVAELFPPLGVVVLHTHNLFLDLIVWTGWPIGLLCTLLLIAWVVLRYLDSGTRERQALFMFLVVVGLHAMLELPLHYAVFLFPSGLVAGVLSHRESERKILRIPVWLGGAVVCVCVVLSALIARDYLLIEERIVSLRLSRFNIVSKSNSDAGPIILLNQFESFFNFSYLVPSEKAEENNLDLGKRVMSIGFNPLNLLHFIEMLAVAGKEDEARLWMRKSLALVGDHLYEDMGQQWVADSKRLTALTQVAWMSYQDISRR